MRGDQTRGAAPPRQDAARPEAIVGAVARIRIVVLDPHDAEVHPPALARGHDAAVPHRRPECHLGALGREEPRQAHPRVDGVVVAVHMLEQALAHDQELQACPSDATVSASSTRARP